MTKHYISDSHIAINVTLDGGESVHLSFIALSNGGSVFSTDSEELQNAIERHYRFGDLFTLDHIEEPKNTSETANGEYTPVKESENGNIQKITVNDLGEAKNYLADTLGISRTSLRSLKTILEVAKANNIEFEGLDK
jgi:conserved domain protein